MPHVVLEARHDGDGRALLAAYEDRFEPFVEKHGDVLVKAERFYRERDARTALVEVVAVDRGHTQKFFVQLSPKGAALTVRLEPLTDPEKTAAVRTALAVVADRVVAASGCVYARSNIEEYLIRREGD